MSVLEDYLDDPSHQGTQSADPVTGGRDESCRRKLRATLIGVDALAVILAWLTVLAMGTRLGVPATRELMLVALAVAPLLTVGCLAWQSLYLARVCSVRSVEIQRLGRATVLVGAVIYMAAEVASDGVPLGIAGAATGAMFGMLLTGRSGYRSWLAASRRSGRFLRRVVLVGANDGARTLHRIVEEHPEMGYRIVGVVAPRHHAKRVSAPWLADLTDAVRAAEITGATGAVIVATALSPAQVNDVSRRLLAAGLHVEMSSGLHGIAAQRLKTTSLAHEPLLYVEQSGLADWQLTLKRFIDVVASAFGLIVFAPTMAFIALAIKLEDRGPLFFAQERVGRHGVLFKLYKLRTMSPDAEQRLSEVAQHNQRDGGPLFKLAADPRVTRVGRVLRALSLDELPQLYNVLRGDMSLVGPRPALPSEVEQFDEELQGRTQVLPGITGMWQVEARDNPAFGPYRRLDLFYVENWSVTLDLGILLATVGSVVGRAWRAVTSQVRRGRGREGGEEVILLD